MGNLDLTLNSKNQKLGPEGAEREHRVAGPGLAVAV